ncbi:MAG: cupin domain-containing protein [Minisyncoccus archaeiphilus]|uniref:phosphomannose isomerase type II C-terminal cupin domain n=1 Tax=Minisyncoccus archaeiphilus TaxID=3238481 RepID=UPI002B170F39|nr:MAG: cupin domain-containing protein [Candidatus Parcubacteria bacterium]
MEKTERPWGYYITLYHDDKINIKIIEVKPKQRLSLQYHHNREENWLLIEGTAICEIGDKEPEQMKPNIAYNIPKEAIHRLSGGDEGCKILEFATGHFSEEDIVRIEDDYARVEDPQL